MAKSAVGWLVPGLALLTLIVWERRWRELSRWPLWAGFSLQFIVIGLWVGAVLGRPNGADDLRVLFWNNLAGRFTHINASPALDYAAAHQNWPGKYFAELPYYIFPWCLLLVGAMRRAWFAARSPANNRADNRADNRTDNRTTSAVTAWRFAVAAWLPFALLISFSATARDVYFAPALLGICAMMAMWVHELDSKITRFDAWMLRGTRYLIVMLLIIVAAVLIILGITELSSNKQLGWISFAITALVVISFTAFKRAAGAQQRNQHAISLAWCYLTTIMALTIVMLAAVPVVNRWQDLGEIAVQVKRDAGAQPLAVLHPDETTIAMLDYHVGMQVTELDAADQSASQLIDTWFKANPRSHVLVMLPGHAAGEITQWLSRFKPQPVPGDGVIDELLSNRVVMIAAHYELPMGRRYALLVAPLHQQVSAAP
jgi:4-amino-4-deoxy-L-arabinose transferase-like glycosyltransferase